MTGLRTRAGVDRHVPLVLLPRTGLGAPGTPRLLLLHGMANSGTAWNRLVERAGEDLTLWSAELPWRDEGVGDWAHDRDPQRWVAEAITRATAEAGPFDGIVAHSFSASLLLRVLAEGSAPRPKKVVLVSPFHKCAPEDFDWELVSGLARTFVEAMLEGIRVVAAGRGNPDLYEAMAVRVCERIGPYGWARFLDTYLTSPWVDLSKVDLPCLVLAGADDGVAPPGDAVDLAAALPSARLRLLPGTGHFPMVESTDDFFTRVTEFFATR